MMGALAGLWWALTSALTLNPVLTMAVINDPWAMAPLAIAVAVVAAVSSMLGHIAILMLNHIRGFRLITALLVSALQLAGLYVVQAAVIWGLAALVVQRPLRLLPLVVVALLALAPQMLSVFTAMPHIGLAIGRGLELWGYLILFLGVRHVFGLGYGWALGLTFGGWLVMQLISRLVQRPLGWVAGRLWTLASGRPTMITSRDILAGMPVVPVVVAPDEADR
ncbi:MAG: hypothetical protein ACK5KO_08100 [Arachnia sp.]